MKKELLNDFTLGFESVNRTLGRLAELENIRERYSGGEPLKISVACGTQEVTERLLLANGKALFVQDLLNAFELQAEITLKTELKNMLNAFENGGEQWKLGN